MKTLKPALFLDLDGTIRRSKLGTGFVNGPDDIELFPDVEEKLWKKREEGFLLLGISNQGGVAHGHKTITQNEEEIRATFALFKRNPFYCVKCAYNDPKGSVEPYNHRSLMRKPDYGLLIAHEITAWELDFIIDWEKSLLVGDRQEDKECAERAAISFEWAHLFFGRSS